MKEIMKAIKNSAYYTVDDNNGVIHIGFHEDEIKKAITLHLKQRKARPT